MLSSMVVQWGCKKDKDDGEKQATAKPAPSSTVKPTVKLTVKPTVKPIPPEKKALVVVDVQASFMALTGRMQLEGSLPVANSEGLPERISKIIEWNEKKGFFDYIIFSQDYHDPGHISFISGHVKSGLKEAHGLNFATVYCRFKKKNARHQDDIDYCCSKTWNNGKSHTGKKCEECGDDEKELCQEIEYPVWPDHCVKGVKSLAPPVSLTDPSPELEQGLRVETKMVGEKTIEVIHILKGTYIDRESFSMFADTGTDIPNGTDEILRSRGITELYFTGLATDFCVGRGALHALDAEVVSKPYKVFMFEDLMHGIIPEGIKKMKEDIENKGGKYITSSSFLLKHGADQFVDKWIAAIQQRNTDKMDKVKKYMETNLTGILADLDTTVEDLEGVLKAKSNHFDHVIRDKINFPDVDKVLRKAGLDTIHTFKHRHATKSLLDKFKVDKAAYLMKINQTKKRFRELGLNFPTDREKIGCDGGFDANPSACNNYNTEAAVLYENIKKAPKNTVPKRLWKEKPAKKKTSHHREADVEENGKKPSHLVISPQE